ncbi:hypothetical protein NDU88_006673 [Pleurodeles waltl]|uniref:Uncharacterized protein n=1 Tax=Pleurodeles waltl TaxID=8319 RepID=A0AAV7NR09_PLEWA|nr:hypothetical protein NDU88_006673 [Pleurodeles waltl]
MCIPTSETKSAVFRRSQDGGRDGSVVSKLRPVPRKNILWAPPRVSERGAIEEDDASGIRRPPGAPGRPPLLAGTECRSGPGRTGGRAALPAEDLSAGRLQTLGRRAPQPKHSSVWGD